jgi:hypothetical protein
MEKAMKIHHPELIITDLTTGITADFNAMGNERRDFRLEFANAGKFTSPEEYRDALHHDASNYAQMLHHHHQHEFLPEDLREIKHEGKPAYIMTVRRHGPL